MKRYKLNSAQKNLLRRLHIPGVSRWDSLDKRLPALIRYLREFIKKYTKPAVKHIDVGPHLRSTKLLKKSWTRVVLNHLIRSLGKEEPYLYFCSRLQRQFYRKNTQFGRLRPMIFKFHAIKTFTKRLFKSLRKPAFGSHEQCRLYRIPRPSKKFKNKTGEQVTLFPPQCYQDRIKYVWIV